MGNIKDKANYLLDTKRLLKSALISTGALIDDNTPLRQYPEVIRTLVAGLNSSSDLATMRALDLVDNKNFTNLEYTLAYEKFQKLAKVHLYGG